jgi:hypothetical protein
MDKWWRPLSSLNKELPVRPKKEEDNPNFMTDIEVFGILEEYLDVYDVALSFFLKDEFSVDVHFNKTFKHPKGVFFVDGIEKTVNAHETYMRIWNFIQDVSTCYIVGTFEDGEKLTWVHNEQNKWNSQDT